MVVSMMPSWPASAAKSVPEAERAIASIVDVPVPVPMLLCVAALLAACLLASSHALAEAARRESEEQQ